MVVTPDKKEVVNHPLYAHSAFDFFTVNEMDGDNRLLRNRMSNLINHFVAHFEQHYFIKYAEAWKNYNQDNSERKQQLESMWQEWRSNISTPFVKMRVDSLFSSINPASVDLNTRARTEEFVSEQEVFKKYLERCFSSSKAKRALVDAIKESIVCGNGFMKVGFKLMKEMVEYAKTKDKNKVFSIEDVAAKLDYCSIFDIFYEEDMLPFHEKRKVIYRRWMPIDYVEDYYSDFISLSQKEKDTIVIRPVRASSKDYTKVKLSNFYEGSIAEISGVTASTDRASEGYNFELMMYDNSYVEVVEYREKKNLVIMLNGYVVYDGINPMPFNNHPFVQVSFQRTPGYTTGVGLGISHDSLQKAHDMLFNAYLDSVKFNVAPMFQADKWFFADNEENTLAYKPFKIITQRGEGKQLTRIEITKPDMAPAQMMDKLTNLADLDAGTNRYSLGWDAGGIERSATGATYMQALTKDRLNPLIDSINEALTKVGEYRAFLGMQFLPYKFKVRITGVDGIDSFEELTHEALKGRFDIEFNSETLKNAQKELEKQQIIQFLQNIGLAGVDPNSKRYLLDQSKILGKALEAFDYGPDVIVGEQAFYDRYISETLAKMRADKAVKDQAQAEWLFPANPYNPGGGWVPMWGWQIPMGGGGFWEWPEPQKIDQALVNPEETERKIEDNNTPKVDLSSILGNMGMGQK